MIVNNVASGGQDIGWALQGYSPGRFPATDVVEMPFVFGSASEATATRWALYQELEALRGEYSDMKVLGLWTTGPGDLWLVDGTASSVADIEELTLRSPGPVQVAVIRALGAIPVNMAAPDLQAVIDAGEIDGLLTADTALATHNLTDMSASGTECRYYVLAALPGDEPRHIEPSVTGPADRPADSRRRSVRQDRFRRRSRLL